MRVPYGDFPGKAWSNYRHREYYVLANRRTKMSRETKTVQPQKPLPVESQEENSMAEILARQSRLRVLRPASSPVAREVERLRIIQRNKNSSGQ